MVQEEDGDPGLLMASVIELNMAPTATLPPSIPASSEQIDADLGEQVLLNEECTRIELKKSPRDMVLGLGASNHMIVEVEVSAELDKGISGKVCFREGSVVDICG